MPYDIRVGDVPPEQRISAMWVWVCIYPHGGEGILSTDMQVFGTTRHMPLMSSQRELAEKLRPVAEGMAAKGLAEMGVVMKVELRQFDRVLP